MFDIPTLLAQVDRVRKAFRSELPGTDAWLWPNNIGPTAKVIGGEMHQLFGRLDYVQRQKFATDAEGEWLDRHGLEIGVARRGSIAAAGTITVTATGAGSAAIGSRLARGDGAVYVTQTAAVFAGAGSLTVAANAELSGQAGNASGGTLLTALSGVAGPLTFALDSSGALGGADTESDDDYRARILFRKRNPPHGGSASDYVLWVGSQPGVTRVFVERAYAGPGTVRVFFLMDDTRTDGIPAAPDVTAVRAAIEPLYPAGAALAVAAPSPVLIPVTINSLSPDTPQVRDAILSNLKAAFRARGRVAGANSPVAGMDYLATPHTFSRSWIWQAVANATGESSHVISLPSSDTSIPAGSTPVLGTVTFA
jgi:uncharacterized phage protein gp47/JayE